jgi:hypothetical protein
VSTKTHWSSEKTPVLGEKTLKKTHWSYKKLADQVKNKEL